MSRSQRYLAIDLGAESGRVIEGQFDGRTLRLAERHRFSNQPVWLPDGLHWAVLRLWWEIQRGLAKAAQERSRLPISLGVDTWGVDFGLLDRQGGLIGNPYHYRDDRTDGMMDAAFSRLPRQEIFRQTGIQFMQLNSLYQLLAMVLAQSPALDVAHTFLAIPDLFNYWLTGRKVCEFTNATTTQCYDPNRADWARPLLAALAIPGHIFPEVVPPGTVLGELRPSLAKETGLAGVTVVAPACHDTGAAVAAVPAAGGRFAWISSGTWSIMGVSVREPVIDDQTLAFNFTNEGGVDSTYRLSKNIMGLWLVQACRQTWASQGRVYSYDELADLAAAAPPLVAIVDPDDTRFLKPGDMPARIRDYCRQTGQAAPESDGAVIRCALESIALKYRWTLDKLEMILGHGLPAIHIIGGGTQNRLLNQLTADATNRPVITGPVEATATGNILMQMIALGHLGSLAQGREMVRRSSDLTTYEPGETDGWDEVYGRLKTLMEASR